METIAFIGGGNMASAIIGGLLHAGRDPESLHVVEPHGPQRAVLRDRFQLESVELADERLAGARLIVWAVKPQTFASAAQAVAPYGAHALHLSVMAGIRSAAIASAMGTDRVVRAMPNTPALIGHGVAGLYARPAVDDAARALVEQVLQPTGQTVWMAEESHLDAVTALSGSGPAYVFYFIEAMVKAAERMGLDAEQGKQLALATFTGAAELARRSTDSPAALRQQVTSKGGTTFAALSVLQATGVETHIIDAVLAAQRRAVELGDEFGGA